MCGIAGFVGGFEETLLSDMSSAISHRGPDDDGMFTNASGRVGLAHRRLAIIDPSPAGHQPMRDKGLGLVLIYNGELYNFRELRSELQEKGEQFTTETDTEVVLAAYRYWGREFLSKLSGIFAFALWDGRTNELLLARDPLGVKPLYYGYTPRGFLFAGELKALLHASDLDRAIDLSAVDSYLHFLWSPGKRTMLKSVRKLEPGTAMIISDGEPADIWRYHALPFGRPISSASTIDTVDSAREILEGAIKRQMVADVPVGAFLSGGLDSSIIVALARQHAQNSHLECFTIGFNDNASAEGMAEDERHANLVAKHLDVPLRTVRVGPEIASLLPEMVYHLDEPQADPAAIHTLLISGLARDHGMKVLLSGAGGDDLFSGYRRHMALQAERYWAWLPQDFRATLQTAASYAPSRPASIRRIGKAFANAGAGKDERMAGYFSWLSPTLSRSLYSDTARADLQDDSPLQPLISALDELPEGTSQLDRMLYLDTRFFLADHNLNYTDKMAMARGVEVRVPLVDQSVVNMATGLDPSFKLRGTTTKWILRSIAKPLLPPAILSRKKVGFGAPMRDWIQGPLEPLISDLLSHESLQKRQLFDPGQVDRLRKLDSQGRIDGSYVIFAIACIELWCRSFIDPTTPRKLVW